jgi:predicted nucleotidyltransferase
VISSSKMRGEERKASGRFVLRIDPGLHGALKRAVREMAVSLNEYCARKLAAPVSSLTGWELVSDTVQRAAAVVGGDLEGVVAFGSWARDELHDGSDVDVLVVVDRSTELSRALYSEWDADPVRWHGHRVEPHFVHLPESSRPVVGLWAEVAIDGVVLFTRGFELPRCLARVRQDIVAERVVRRVVHGQPYWVLGV